MSLNPDIGRKDSALRQLTTLGSVRFARAARP